ncbi:MAG: ATP synthase F1 subunit delta [Bacteroidales bacterium]|jgi:F-type H+-transporting ATPase subunit delta|nr:ATP synthase F1 subunit delta [Bacteroidales bacterium]
MNSGKIAVRYAKALYELAKERDIVDVVYSDIQLIHNTFKEYKQIRETMHNPVLPLTNKAAILKSLFQDKISADTEKFITIIVENDRCEFIERILYKFFDIVREARGIKEVEFITASPVDDNTRDKITTIISEQYKAQIELKETVNPDIIGGFVLRVDDKMIDSSISSELKMIRRELLKTNVN